ncbi:MAG: adenosine deaminase [Treponema sp. CETP13]|nr:MAG: adenosine deaminase [Treponema sp. CETP13]
MKKLEFYTFMKKIPKAEIHIHSEAAVTEATIKKLYQQNKDSSLINSKELDNFFSFNNLSEFVQCFIKLQKLLKTPEDLKYLFEDLGSYLQNNNIVYAEVFFSPTSFLRKGFEFKEMLSIIDSKIDQIKKEKGITVKLIIDVSRTFGVENAMHNLSLIQKLNDSHIIGIGLGGDELNGPAKEYAEVFKEAKKVGLHVVAHAGEDVGPQSIIDSINYLGIERIGHGITAIQDKELVKRLTKSQIPLEICVTSNLFTKKVVKKMSEHPVRYFYDEGVFITINSDDPSFFKVSITDEYWNLYSQLNFTMKEIKQLVLNGFDAAFISVEEKKKYTDTVLAAWEKAEKEVHN